MFVSGRIRTKLDSKINGLVGILDSLSLSATPSFLCLFLSLFFIFSLSLFYLFFSLFPFFWLFLLSLSLSLSLFLSLSFFSLIPFLYLLHPFSSFSSLFYFLPRYFYLFLPPTHSGVMLGGESCCISIVTSFSLIFSVSFFSSSSRVFFSSWSSLLPSSSSSSSSFSSSKPLVLLSSAGSLLKETMLPRVGSPWRKDQMGSKVEKKV